MQKLRRVEGLVASLLLEQTKETLLKQSLRFNSKKSYQTLRFNRKKCQISRRDKPETTTNVYLHTLFPTSACKFRILVAKR